LASVRAAAAAQYHREPVSPPTAIVVVAHQGADHLPRVLGSCRAHGGGAAVYVVDNASTDGSAELVARDFPEVRLLVQSRNLGFGGGCNAGIRDALDAGARQVMLLNQDAELTAGCVEMLASFLDAHAPAAAVQPAVMRDDGRVNSLGNPVHYLAFSMAGGNGRSEEQAERDASLPWLHDGRWRREAVAIPACSGAAVMLRAEALRDVGLFEERLFLYNEDLELCLRLRAAGWSLWLLGPARVVHHYAFHRNPDKFFYLERNRGWILLTHYRVRSLLVLAVPMLLAEATVLLLALRNGWLGEKLRAWGALGHHGALRGVRQRRRELARIRRRRDRDVLASCTDRLVADETSSLLTRVLANPASALCWRLLRPLLG
jgi:GT2 family glycosyltransferase